MDYAARGARWLLGATAHPGGEALSRHLLDVVGVRAGDRVADVACGAGPTLRLLAGLGARPVGLDLSPAQVRRADGHAVVADAHSPPLRPGAFDAVVCECAVSTFDRPEQAVAAMAGLLRPGGRLGMTDVLLDRDAAPPEVVAAVDRLTTARPLAGWTSLLTGAGLVLEVVEDRSADAAELAGRVARRLRLVGARRAAATARACERAVADGSLGYALLVARRPDVGPS